MAGNEPVIKKVLNSKIWEVTLTSYTWPLKASWASILLWGPSVVFPHPIPCLFIFRVKNIWLHFKLTHTIYFSSPQAQTVPSYASVSTLEVKRGCACPSEDVICPWVITFKWFPTLNCLVWNRIVCIPFSLSFLNYSDLQLWSTNYCFLLCLSRNPPVIRLTLNTAFPRGWHKIHSL